MPKEVLGLLGFHRKGEWNPKGIVRTLGEEGTLFATIEVRHDILLSRKG